MNIEAYNLDSLRKLVRSLQDENKYENSQCLESGLRIYCADRTRARQLAACVHQIILVPFFMGICARKWHGHKIESAVG